MDEQKEESEKVLELSGEAASVIPVEASDNLVLRKLLRGGRYFDPPNSFPRICFRCNEGHTAGKCAGARLRKPCYKCGRRNHNVKRCAKRKDCLICKKGGHRAKDCPEKHPGPQDPITCLKCGDAGHDMFSCKSSYSADDLKDIECYICRNYGHLCCAEYTNSGPAEVSCYRCGELGHSGLDCSMSYGSGSRTACYKCGEEGHFAHKCPSSIDGGERNSELVPPKKRRWNKRKARSLRNDTNQDFDDQESKSVSNHRGLQVLATNDHDTSNGSEYKVNGQTSPATVSNNSNGPLELNQHSLSASQFGSDCIDAIQRDINC